MDRGRKSLYYKVRAAPVNRGGDFLLPGGDWPPTTVPQGRGRVERFEPANKARSEHDAVLMAVLMPWMQVYS